MLPKGTDKMLSSRSSARHDWVGKKLFPFLVRDLLSLLINAIFLKKSDPLLFRWDYIPPNQQIFA